MQRIFLIGGSGGDRTRDLGLKRPLLYQLSYRPVLRFQLRADASVPTAVVGNPT